MLKRTLNDLEITNSKVVSTIDDIDKTKNIQPNMLRDNTNIKHLFNAERYETNFNSRFSNKDNLKYNNNIYEYINQDREDKYLFDRHFVDTFDDKILQLSGSTVELPQVDLSEKKFLGKNRLYIGNIGMEITEEDITDLFKAYGETSEIFINKDKKFGFVKLDYYNNAEKAKKELDGFVFKSKSLKVRFAPSSTTVKVRNITPFTTNELLHYAFSVFGEIDNCVVLVDEKGKSLGEGIIDFARKGSAIQAIRKCKEECYFLSNTSKPVIVEPYEIIDHVTGLLDKNFNKKNFDFNQERMVGPRLAVPGSFEYDYGSRWKALYDLYRQKEEALRVEFRLEGEKMEAQMEYARVEHETEELRQKLYAREMDKERQKREWEAKERQVEKEKLRAEAHIRHAQDEIQSRMTRKQEELRRRQEDETNLFNKAHNLTSIINQQQEQLDYEIPTSSTTGLFCDHTSYSGSQDSLFGSHHETDSFQPRRWSESGVNEKGHWVRETIQDNGYPKRRRF